MTLREVWNYKKVINNQLKEIQILYYEAPNNLKPSVKKKNRFNTNWTIPQNTEILQAYFDAYRNNDQVMELFDGPIPPDATVWLYV